MAETTHADERPATGSGPGAGMTNAEGAKEAAAQAATEAKDTAAHAVEAGQDLAQTGLAEAKELAGTVKDQVGQVGQEVSAQARNLLAETRAQVKAQGQAQTDHLAETFKRLGDQLVALVEGRTEEAGVLSEYAAQGAQRLQGLAKDLQSGGLDGVRDDLRRFARRRPAAFLAGAALAGFAVGRVVKGDPDGNGHSSSPGPSSSAADGVTSNLDQPAYGEIGEQRVAGS